MKNTLAKSLIFASLALGFSTPLKGVAQDEKTRLSSPPFAPGEEAGIWLLSRMPKDSDRAGPNPDAVGLLSQNLGIVEVSPVGTIRVWKDLFSQDSTLMTGTNGSFHQDLKKGQLSNPLVYRASYDAKMVENDNQELLVQQFKARLFEDNQPLAAIYYFGISERWTEKTKVSSDHLHLFVARKLNPEELKLLQLFEHPMNFWLYRLGPANSMWRKDFSPKQLREAIQDKSWINELAPEAEVRTVIDTYVNIGSKLTESLGRAIFTPNLDLELPLMRLKDGEPVVLPNRVLPMSSEIFFEIDISPLEISIPLDQQNGLNLNAPPVKLTRMLAKVERSVIQTRKGTGIALVPVHFETSDESIVEFKMEWEGKQSDMGSLVFRVELPGKAPEFSR